MAAPTEYNSVYLTLWGGGSLFLAVCPHDCELRIANCALIILLT